MRSFDEGEEQKRPRRILGIVVRQLGIAAPTMTSFVLIRARTLPSPCPGLGEAPQHWGHLVPLQERCVGIIRSPCVRAGPRKLGGGPLTEGGLDDPGYWTRDALDANVSEQERGMYATVAAPQ